MKLPSLHLALQDARATFDRFPFIILDAVTGSCAAFILIDHEGAEEPTILFKLLFAAILGLPLLLAFALYSERHHHGRLTAWGLQGLGIVLLALFTFTVPMDMRYAPESVIIRFIVLAAASSFLVMAMPATAGGTGNGLWHFNWRIFIRGALTGLYTVVLFAGFALALAALDNLFGVHIRPQRYGELWVILLGLFAPWFFLAGVPADHAHLETEKEYPRGLRVFALYILGPIVLAYLVILYAYLIKVLIAWDWPKGWVSGLIFGFAGCGILLSVILRPLTENVGSAWIKRAATAFYLALIPLIVMLFFAIGRRVTEYGLTESRYLAFAVAGWLAIIVLHQLLSRTKALWFIPLSLCVSAIAISAGPWGMFHISESSQIARLERLLTAGGALKDGKVTAVHQEISLDDAQRISGILEYLRGRHGFAGIQQWFESDLHAGTSGNINEYKTPAAVAELMGIRFVQYWEGPDGGTITLTAARSFSVNGYEHLARLPQYANADEHVDTLGGGICIKKSDGLNRLVFTLPDSSTHLLTVDLNIHAGAILKDHSTASLKAVPDSVMMLRASGNGLSVCICPWTLQVWKKEGTYRVNYLDAIVLYTYVPAR